MFPVKQVVAPQVGSHDVLTVAKTGMRAPEDGEVVVKVETSGFLYGGIIRRTDRYLATTYFLYHPGRQIPGTIAATGSRVTNRKIGGRVAGFAPSHDLAKSAAMVDLPTATGFENAAALLAEGTTAYLLTRYRSVAAGRSSSSRLPRRRAANVAEPRAPSAPCCLGDVGEMSRSVNSIKGHR